MIDDQLPWEEQDALRKILAHHGVNDPALTKDLAIFGNWMRQDVEDKTHFRTPKAPFLLSLLGMMGVLHPKKESHA